MQENFDIVEARTEQAEEISKLVNSAYRGDSSRKGWTTEADLLDGQRTDPESITNILKDPIQKILVAEDPEADDRILACVHLTKEGSVCWLGMLTVDPQLQDEGLGKFLLTEAESFAKFWGCTEIKMKVISLRSELIKWYERRGFRATNDREPFPINNPKFGLPKRQDLEFQILTKSLIANNR